jgi:hypothetical protein
MIGTFDVGCNGCVDCIGGILFEFRVKFGASHPNTDGTINVDEAPNKVAGEDENERCWPS